MFLNLHNYYLFEIYVIFVLYICVDTYHINDIDKFTVQSN